MPSRRYGKVLRFRGIDHAPTNEQGVVVLFGAVLADLGYRIAHVWQEFPDAELFRELPDGTSERILAEFELKSSEFLRHGHPVNKCDLIICWKHDWKRCPLQVLELAREVESLRALEQLQDDNEPQWPLPQPAGRPVGRKRPEIKYPPGFQTLPDAATRIAKLLSEKEQNVHMQLWRYRDQLPLARDKSGVLLRGPRKAYLLKWIKDAQLMTIYYGLGAQHPGCDEEGHHSIASAAKLLGFGMRQGLSRKIRHGVRGWVPDCHQHKHCFTSERIREIVEENELCTPEERLALLSTSDVRSVFKRLGIEKDRHAVVNYTKKKQLPYYRRHQGRCTEA